ncbi:YutD family protein [Leuconostoc falkenbergense]|uniref:YutD family protein n=1 Tax=Leuconostoc falkenbergense TaxID=2766470 RepID=UPI0024A9CF65|nr:YutD family protein [Leuconostoc falkenbergense]MDI6552823.1 YutD family protein [Leuconostoc falkenbergense]
MDHETLKEKTIAQQAERKSVYRVTRRGDEIEIDRLTLELVDNFKDAFDVDKLAIRYTPLLAQYDYIVGDISAEQLRLKGFYHNDKPVANQDKIQTLQDYLYEYVNFGAPYFVLENINPRVREPRENISHKPNAKPKRESKDNKQRPKTKSKSKSKNGKPTAKKPSTKKRSFTIKQK